MKTIGLLGGTSWPSTPLYYQAINEMVQARRGGHHSAAILLKSIDYHAIKSLYNAPDGWDKIPALLKEELDGLAVCRPDCLIVCNNTLHKALDILRYEEHSALPLFHAVTETGKAMQRENIREGLLLATPFTMKDGFFAQGLARMGITTTLPDPEEQNTIGAIQARLAQGKHDPSMQVFFHDLVKKHKPASVILACTELPLAFKEEASPVPLFNSIVCQCRAAVDYAL